MVSHGRESRLWMNAVPLPPTDGIEVMELNVLNKKQRQYALTLLLIALTLTGCSSVGGSKWSLGRKDAEKADKLATYRENEKAVQTDGDIIPPANKAKPEATIALGERRLADSGLTSGFNGPQYNESLDQLNSPQANPAGNYANVENMTAQANAAAAGNSAPVAYKEENASPMDVNAFPNNVPPIVTSPSQAVASNANASPSDPPEVPPIPDLGMPPVPTNSQVASDSPITPAVVNESVQNNNAIAPVHYQSDISESEAQAYTPSNGAFLPGSLDMNRFESEFSPANSPSTSTSTNPYPITPPDAPSSTGTQNLPGLSQNNPSLHELKNQFNNQKMVAVKNSGTAMTEADFCSLGYHEVANLATGVPVVAKASPVSSPRHAPAEYNVIPVVQTSLVRPAEESNGSPIPINPESIVDSAPPILMNITPLN